MRSCATFCLSASCLFTTLLLTGCAFGPAAVPATVVGAAIHGVVHGGQQPVGDAKIFLFAANTTGYGGYGIAPSTSNASLSLLKLIPGTTNLDTTTTDATYGDYYVLSFPDGEFTITGDYTCTAGQQVYLYAVGGNPGLADSTNNTAAGFLAILGDCPAAGNFAATVPSVSIDEVSTVAAAYAFAGFASDALHVSSANTALAKTGIANAFANAANLASISSGQALTTTPAGNGTVPQTTINTIANILAACVNSTSAASTGCSTLFTNIESAGATGTAATDTATAAIYLAQTPFPGTTQMSNLFGNASAITPFSPALTTQPTGFILGLNFTGGGLSYPANLAIDASGDAWVVNNGTPSITKLSSTGAALSPSSGFTGGGITGTGFLDAIAIDNTGNAWIAVSSNSTVTKLSSTGAPISSSSGYSGGGLKGPTGVAIDASGNVWFSNGGSPGAFSKLSSAGSAISPTAGYTGGGMNVPNAIAIDGAGNVWDSNSGGASLSKLSNAGSAISSSSGYTGGGLKYPSGVAIDAGGNVWTLDQGSAISKLSNTGGALSPSTGYTGGGLDGAEALAIDGAGSVWAVNFSNNSVSRFSSTGTALSPSSGYTGGGIKAGTYLAIDGAGNIWISNYSSNGSVTEIIGSAAPVITPLCAGLPTTATNNGTSNLGTRP